MYAHTYKHKRVFYIECNKNVFLVFESVFFRAWANIYIKYYKIKSDEIRLI